MIKKVSFLFRNKNTGLVLLDVFLSGAGPPGKSRNFFREGIFLLFYKGTGACPFPTISERCNLFYPYLRHTQ